MALYKCIIIIIIIIVDKIIPTSRSFKPWWHQWTDTVNHSNNTDNNVLY